MIIRTEKLQVGYGNKPVVTDINLDLLAGQFVGLLGPNGSGKSTILKTIIRLLAPLGGDVYLGDVKLHQLSNHDMAKTTAVVLTDPIMPGLLNVYDIVMLGRHPHTGFTGKPADDDHQKVLAALEMVNASNLKTRYFTELSDGEKQKVLLARALAQEPKLIVLDEPTSHLDARHRIEVLLILRQLTQGKGVTVVASLHDIDLAMKACDVVILVKDEHILACGTPEDMLTDNLVAELYTMEQATFSNKLGGVELRSQQGNGLIFVVAGSSSGSSLYRALAKHRFSIVTGILSESEIDFNVAQAIGAKIISVPPYDYIKAEITAEALRLIEGAAVVIDAGFPIGTLNRPNIELINYALKKGLVVGTLRDRSEAAKLYGNQAGKMHHYQDYFELISAVRKIYQ